MRRLAIQFRLIDGILFKRASNGLLLRCLSKNEALKVMREIHAGECGPHMNGVALAKKIQRQGYFWLTMMADCIEEVKKCHECQIHGEIPHLPPTELQNLSTPWPFSAVMLV